MANPVGFDTLKKRVGVTSTTVLNPVTGTVGTTATRLLLNDPARFKADFFNPSNFQVLVLNSNLVTATNGILLDSSGGWIESNIEEDEELTVMEWWGIALGSSAKIIVLASVLVDVVKAA